MDPLTYVRNFIDFAARDGGNHVSFVLVTSQPAGGGEPNQRPAIVSFAEGDLSASNGGRVLSGRARQLFSDRRTAGSWIAPFDENQPDDLGVEITADVDAPWITLTAHDWGDARQTLTDLRWQDGVLVASGATIGNQTPSACYVVSLGQNVAPG